MDDTTSSMYLAFMIFGGFVGLTVVGILAAVGINQLRKWNALPRHPHRL